MLWRWSSLDVTYACMSVATAGSGVRVEAGHATEGGEGCVGGGEGLVKANSKVTDLVGGS